MGLWSGLKTLGKEIASGAKDISVGYGRLRDAAKKTLGGVDRNLEGKTLMRFGNETEARWVSPFRPTSRKVFGDISYESTERLSNAVTNIAEEEAAAFDRAILAKRSTAETAQKFSRNAEEQVTKINNAASEDYFSLLEDAGEATIAEQAPIQKLSRRQRRKLEREARKAAKKSNNAKEVISNAETTANVPNQSEQIATKISQGEQARTISESSPSINNDYNKISPTVLNNAGQEQYYKASENAQKSYGYIPTTLDSRFADQAAEAYTALQTGETVKNFIENSNDPSVLYRFKGLY